MRNVYFDEGTTRDIDQRIDRVLKDLGDPTGKVELADVRDLLRLDLHYYTSADPTLVEEVVHKLRIGTKQVIERPSILLDVVKKLDLRALFLPDRKRILIDSTLPELKKRWSETHEISHSLIPWHADFMLGDNRLTLSPSCDDRIEAEANYGAGRLLFPEKSFLEVVKSKAPSMAHIREISRHFGNTITTTLWRYVENNDDVAFATIGEHPHYAREGKPEIAYFIRSRYFEKQFSAVSERQVFDLIGGYCSYRQTGPLGESEIVLLNDNGVAYIFSVDTFSIKHHVLTLGHCLKKRVTQVQVPL